MENIERELDLKKLFTAHTLADEVILVFKNKEDFTNANQDTDCFQINFEKREIIKHNYFKLLKFTPFEDVSDDIDVQSVYSNMINLKINTNVLLDKIA